MAIVVLVSAILAVVVAAPVARADFGIKAFDQEVTSDPAGDPYTQAGGHPYAVITHVALNSHPDAGIEEFLHAPAELPDVDAKDVAVKLPPGLLGNPNVAEQCTDDELAGASEPSAGRPAECPVGSVVGTIHLETPWKHFFFAASGTVPLFNMVPPVGAPAKFGFNVFGVPITLTANVRNGGDFGVTVLSANIPVAIAIDGFDTTFWGVPADPRHDAQRCDTPQYAYTEGPLPVCTDEPGTKAGPNSLASTPEALLTMPVSCTPPGAGMFTEMETDSWQQPGIFLTHGVFSHLPPGFPAGESEWGAQQGITGCGVVPFKPSIAVQPTNHQADTPSGLSVDVSLPQDGLTNPAGISTADVKKTVVTLPAGVSVSPSAADGLGACSLEQVGLGQGTPAQCPDSSQLASVEVVTPVLSDPLKGHVYLGKQTENPFGSLIAMYLVAEGSGVVLKLPGQVQLDSQTGQITTVFDNSPQLPFSELKLDFDGGTRSPLVNPHTCGTYTTTAELTPWSGNPPMMVSDSFQITSGPGGSPCPAPQQFAPGFTVGTVNNQAGAFSPLSLTMSRADGDQQLGGVSMTLPTGLLGTLSSVALCGEPQAAQGACGPESQIGTLTVAAGAGATPFYVNDGKVFATGPYRGAPYGLSVVVPAKAGPFDLGTVVVRGTIAVDRHTAALTILTDPLPTMLQGIPLDLRVINVSIDRPAFIFNPTNCDPQAITGTLTGGNGLSEPVGSRFQATNCARLGFKPSFKVTTTGKTSRLNGAGLDAKLAYPKNSMGTQANIAMVKVSLPKQLPSRLTTLQKACPAETFDANPASCPAGSRIGSAVAHTPVLPVELSGSVYFVSHGGEAFPDLVVVLQGYGVTIDLVGTTFISKAGITSTTFKQVPDVPIETFELKLPQGPNSALAANGNLCAGKLAMPTLFLAQDGTTIKQSTPVTPTGCNKHKAKRKVAKQTKHKKKR
ncbi:MAG TPA: hypothetical protein VGI76_08950 [Solirubrobacteraceae bacterium]